MQKKYLKAKMFNKIIMGYSSIPANAASYRQKQSPNPYLKQLIKDTKTRDYFDSLIWASRKYASNVSGNQRSYAPSLIKLNNNYSNYSLIKNKYNINGICQTSIPNNGLEFLLRGYECKRQCPPLI